MKHLISKTAFCLFIVFFSLSSIAQPQGTPQDKKERIDALKVSFITQKLELTREEAQRFWPVYNEYQKSRDALRTERKEQFRNYSERFDELSDGELTELVDKQIIYRQRDLDLMKKYHAEFKSVLPVRKVALLYRAEDEFKAKVMQEIKNR